MCAFSVVIVYYLGLVTDGQAAVAFGLVVLLVPILVMEEEGCDGNAR